MLSLLILLLMLILLSMLMLLLLSNLLSNMLFASAFAVASLLYQRHSEIETMIKIMPCKMQVQVQEVEQLHDSTTHYYNSLEV